MIIWRLPLYVRPLLAAMATAAFVGVGAAQTIVTPTAPDTQTLGLVDRVDALQADLQKATAENERLQHELALANDKIASLQKTLDESNASSEASAAKPAPKPVAGGDDAAGSYKQAYDLVVQNQYADAESSFRAFLASYPKDARAPDAHYWLGQSLLAQGKNADAAEQYLGIVKSTPKALKAPDAYLNLGVATKAMGQAAAACAIFKDVPVKFPKASEAVKTKAAARAKSCPA